MKTALITMLLAVVVLLGPPMMATGDPAVVVNHQAALNNVQQIHATARPLSHAEMNDAVGSGLLGCESGKDANGDVHETCCFSLWIFSICVDVNWSALDRVIQSLF